MDKQLNIRVSQQDLDRWKFVAGDRNLASWVRRTLNEASQPAPERKDHRDHENHR